MGQVHGDPLAWLLEPDADNPGVRYFALRDLLGRPPDAPEVVTARADVMATGPVPVMLAAQNPDGGWQRHGPGYSPKYTAVVWQVTFLAQLGADGSDPRVRRACEYVLEHSRARRRFRLEKYLGKWYEIARLDHSFERGPQSRNGRLQYAA